MWNTNFKVPYFGLIQWSLYFTQLVLINTFLTLDKVIATVQSQSSFFSCSRLYPLVPPIIKFSQNARSSSIRKALTPSFWKNYPRKKYSWSKMEKRQWLEKKALYAMIEATTFQKWSKFPRMNVLFHVSIFRFYLGPELTFSYINHGKKFFSWVHGFFWIINTDLC